MEQQQHSIDDIFRESLGDYREMPPAAAWEEIERRLDRNKKKRRGAFWYWPWVSLVLLLAASGTWLVVAGTGAANQSAFRDAEQKQESITPPAISSAKTAPPGKNGDYLTPESVAAGQKTTGISPQKITKTSARLAASESFSQRDAVITPRAKITDVNSTAGEPAPDAMGAKDPTEETVLPAPARKLPAPEKIETVPGSYWSVQLPALRPVTPQSSSALLLQTNSPYLKAHVADSVIAPANATGVLSQQNEKTSLSEEENQHDTGQLKSAKSQRFRLGLLLGGESSFKTPLPNRAALSAQVAYQLSPSVSIAVHPAYRIGNLNSQQLTPDDHEIKAYPQKVIASTMYDSQSNTTYYNYRLVQPFDSIVTDGTRAAGRLWEVEVPVVFNYRMPGSRWSFYGGPSLSFGGRLPIRTGGGKTTYSYEKVDSLTFVNKPVSYGYIGTSYSLPAPPTVAAATNTRQQEFSSPNAFRLGYAVGIGYDWKGLLINVSLHQQLSGYSMVDEMLRKIYSRPYFRIGLGYRLFGGR